jgi:hypothetical protein
MVEPALAFAGVIVLVVSLIMTTAFFTLNSNLEDENRSLKEKLKKYE